MLSQADLKSVLSYNQKTGLFTWAIKTCNINIGDIAGCQNNRGYIAIRINNVTYLAHRLAWLYVTGKWPEQGIDHVNRITNDNRFSNLREATTFQNHQNRNKPKHNTSGFKGVHFNKSANKWQARIGFNGKRKHLGLFDSPEIAYQTYIEAAKIEHKNFFNV